MWPKQLMTPCVLFIQKGLTALTESGLASVINSCRTRCNKTDTNNVPSLVRKDARVLMALCTQTRAMREFSQSPSWGLKGASVSSALPRGTN